MGLEPLRQTDNKIENKKITAKKEKKAKGNITLFVDHFRKLKHREI